MTFPPTHIRSLLLGLALSVAVLLLDQWSKTAILQFFNPENTEISHSVTSFFNLVLVWNQGVSFGLFNNHGEKALWPLIAVAGVISLVLLEWLRRSSRPIDVVAIGLILGGAIGNVIDRLRFGAVVDFLDFHLAGAHWPAFNVADSCICIGVLVLCYDSLFKKSA